jgi:hypothetical protein
MCYCFIITGIKLVNKFSLIFADSYRNPILNRKLNFVQLQYLCSPALITTTENRSPTLLLPPVVHDLTSSRQLVIAADNELNSQYVIASYSKRKSLRNFQIFLFINFLVSVSFITEIMVPNQIAQNVQNSSMFIFLNTITL